MSSSSDRGRRLAGLAVASVLALGSVAATSGTALVLVSATPATVEIDGSVVMVHGAVALSAPSGSVLVERLDAPTIPVCEGATVEMSAAVVESENADVRHVGAAAVVDVAAGGWTRCVLG